MLVHRDCVFFFRFEGCHLDADACGSGEERQALAWRVLKTSQQFYHDDVESRQGILSALVLMPVVLGFGCVHQSQPNNPEHARLASARLCEVCMWVLASMVTDEEPPTQAPAVPL